MILKTDDKFNIMHDILYAINPKTTQVFSYTVYFSADEDTSEPTEGEAVVATVECYGDRMVLSLTERRNVALFHLFDSGK